MQPNNQPMYQQGPVMPPQQGMPMGQVQLPKDKPPLGFILGLAISILLFIIALGFGVWAFMQMQDYKNNSDKKAAAAVVVANTEQKKQLDAQFAEQEKSPLKSYTSPSQFGSVKIVYPKTYSAYVVEQSAGSSNPVDAYFNPDVVPGVQGKNSYSLRMQVSTGNYKAEVEQFKSLAQQGKVTVTAFKPEQVPDAAVGVRIDGQIASDKKGTLVILPLRDKVLKVWTETDSAQGDYGVVLKNLTYSP